MAKYVVTYTWKEACYVEADTPAAAEDIADCMETDLDELELGGVRIRKARRSEVLACTFEGAEEA